MTIQYDPKPAKRVSLTRRRESDRANMRWWAAERETMHLSVDEVTRAISDRLSGVRDRQVINRLAYEEIDAYQRYGAGPDVSASERHGRIALNVVQMATDTVASMVVRNRPRALFLTSGGDRKMRRRARLMTKVVHAIMKSADVYDAGEEVFTDAAIEKLGAWYLYVDGDAIKSESVPPNEILIDQSEGRRRLPTQVHRRKPVARDWLLHKFPQFAEEIERVSPIEDLGGDLVHVVYSWHLPSGDGAGDGCHAITIDGCTLHSEEYTKPYYPFVFYRWYKAGHGFWGRAIPDEIGSIQRMINSLLTSVHHGAALAASQKWLVEKASQVNKEHLLSNEYGAYVEYNQTPPQTVTPTPFPDWVPQLIWTLVQQAMHKIGSNMQAAGGMKPSGVESARAIREATDREGGRVLVPSRRYEDCFPEIAEIIVDMAKDLYGEKSEIEILVQERQDAVRPVKWSEVDMQRDKYKISVFPVSSLPVDPEGRLAQVQELVQAGFLSFDSAVELLEFPDLESEVTRITATRRIVEGLIEMITEDEEYPVRLKPLPQWNLGLAAELANEAVPIAQAQGCSDRALELLMLLAEDIAVLLAPQKAAEQAQAAAMAPPPLPPGAPMPGPPNAPPGHPAPPPGAPMAPSRAA